MRSSPGVHLQVLCQPAGRTDTFLRTQGHHGGAAACVQGKPLDRLLARQACVDEAPEASGPLAVDDAHQVDTLLAAGIEIIRDQLPDLIRTEGVEVQRAVNGDLVWCHACSELALAPA